MPSSRGCTKCTLEKNSQMAATPARISGSQLLPPGRMGMRKLGPPVPPPRRGPSGPRLRKISSIDAERRGPSPSPPPGSQGLRGPRGPSPPETGSSLLLPSPPSPPSSPLPLPPCGLPQGLRLPAMASAILSKIPPCFSIHPSIGGKSAKNRGGRRNFRCTAGQVPLAGWP